MSVEAIKWAFDFEARNSSEKAILLVLANFADGEGTCFPGQESIAKRAACSDRTVRTVLADLEERGVIRREERRRKDGYRTSDAIIICSLKTSPENSSGDTKPHRKILSISPENSSGLTSLEPIREPSDSLSETLSDAPKPAKRRNAYPEPFEESWRAYPTDPNMSKKETFDAWKRLDATDRTALLASIPAFVAYCRSHPDYRPIHMCRYIAKRRFDGHGQQQSLSAEAGERRWQSRLAMARRERVWSTVEWGPMPGLVGCRAPPHLLQPGDGNGWREWERDAA